MKKRFLSIILILAMIFNLLPSLAIQSAVLAAGDDITIISTADELIELANASWGEQQELWAKTYELAGDIDMKEATITGKSMKPIGSSSRPFTGTFDGKGYVIKNLEFEFTSTGGGLFNTISADGMIKNLGIEDARLRLGTHSGILAGENKGIIENCFVVDSILTSTSNTVGGLVGVNNGTVEKSFADNCIVKSEDSYSTTTGGLVGSNEKIGSIKQSYASATIEAKKWIGGLVGQNHGSVENSYAFGIIRGTEQIGGLVGRSDSGSSTVNSYANVDVFPTISGSGFIGGLNYSGGTAVNCFYNSERQLPTESSTDVSGVTEKTSTELKSDDILAILNGGQNIWAKAENINEGFPYIIAIPPKPTEEVPTGISVKVMVATYNKNSYKFKKHIDPIDILIDKEKPTVLDILEEGKDKIPYISKTGTYGEFVESIDGIEASAPDGWMFTINDKTPPVGVSTATVKDEDKILWFYGSPLNNFKGPKWDELLASVPEEGEESDELQGKGTEEEPYLIEKPTDFNHVMEYPKAHFKVNKPIDLSGISFEPIGTEDNPFMGNFDGNNQEISNLTIKKDKNSKNIGFFGVLIDAKVVNVKITNANIVGGSRLGILAGWAKEDKNGACLIGNCHVTGKITGLGTDVAKATRIGGLVGINDGNNTVEGTGSGSYVYSAIDKSSADVEVIGQTAPADDAGNVGGLVGWNRGVISNSFASGNVKGGNTTGGLAGSNWEQIYTSYATGNVTGSYSTGGFVGSSSIYSTIEDSYSTGNVIGSVGSGNYFGGFAGIISGAVKNCISTGTLMPGWSWNGGFAGFYDGNNIEKDIENSYGNSTDYLGNTIKGFGNLVDTTNPNYDKYKSVGVSFEEAKGKLKTILDVTLPEKEENEDKRAVKSEAEKYVDSVIIHKTVAKGTNITEDIVKLKDNMEIGTEISLVYSQKEYTGYITDKAPAGQFTLIKQNNTENNEKTSVTLVFIKNGEFETKDVEVIIEGTLATDPEDKIVIESLSEETIINGKDAKLKYKVTNLTDENIHATFTVGLYDKNTDKLINYSSTDKEFRANEEIEVEAIFLIPLKGEYYIKKFISK